MTARLRVVLVYPLPDAPAEQRLRDEVEVVVPAGDDEASLRKVLGEADGIILRGPARLSTAMIAESPRLRVVGSQGSGTDNIAIDAATERGIPVVHGAGVAARAVAEYAVAGMVAGHRRLIALHRLIASGELQWGDRMGALGGTQLTGTTLGIIGYGYIGRDVARLATAAFEVRVLAYDPFIGDGGDWAPAQRCDDLGTLLDESLTVSVHVPLSDRTRGLLGRAELRRIGPNGVLIDTARGGVVDEDALLDALAAGDLKAAVLDVFDNEPPSAEQLARVVATPNLLATPHVAGVTDQGLQALSHHVVDGVLAVLAGRRPPRVVNPDALRTT